MSIIRKIRENLILFSRNKKILLTVFSDIFILNINFLLSYFYLFFLYSSNFELFSSEFPFFSVFYYFNFIEILLSTFIAIFLIYFLNGYKSFFRSSDVIGLIGSSRILSIFTFSFILLFIIYFKNFSNVAFTFGWLSLISIFFYFITFRMLIFRFLSYKSINDSIPILIYGAGQAGIETAAYLSQNKIYKVLGFIDDDKLLKNFSILGYKVFGGIRKIRKLKRNYPKLLVIMAMINIKSFERRKIISAIENFEVEVKTIPSNYGSLQNKLSIENIEASDLIDRQLVEPDLNLLNKNVRDKVVLITGAGGSIGSEIASQVASNKPKKLILIDFSEFNLYRLKEKFQSFNNFDDMKFILEDIKNIKNIDSIIKKEKVNTIYHAAAYKHVPLLEIEENFQVAIENNFLATFNLCEISMYNFVETFILISTDKAVNPPNVMGATKRLSELSLQAFQSSIQNNTIFSMVRFGNVLNSSGSVVPTFWEQIYSGGPVTVTHQDINRYFMTIKEAASLVIQAGALAIGGEVFLLDMGDPIKIKELAEKMIRLSGNSVASETQSKGIKIIYSGLRPGEKIYEELLLSNDFIETKHARIKKGIEDKFNLDEIKILKKELEILIDQKKFEKAKLKISNYVTGYHL